MVILSAFSIRILSSIVTILVASLRRPAQPRPVRPHPCTYEVATTEQSTRTSGQTDCPDAQQPVRTAYCSGPGEGGGGAPEQELWTLERGAADRAVWRS